MLDAVKLATLRAVVEHGSFTAAGQALALTQPAVSRQISLLERQLGLALVRRTQTGVRPTEAGLRPPQPAGGLHGGAPAAPGGEGPAPGARRRPRARRAALAR